MINIEDENKSKYETKVQQRFAIACVVALMNVLNLCFITTVLIFYCNVDLYAYDGNKAQVSFSQLTGLDENNVSNSSFSKKSETDYFFDDEKKDFVNLMSNATYTELPLINAFSKIFIIMSGNNTYICSFSGNSDCQSSYDVYTWFGKIYLISYISDAEIDGEIYITLYCVNGIGEEDVMRFSPHNIDSSRSDDTVYQYLYSDKYSAGDIRYMWYFKLGGIYCGLSLVGLSLTAIVLLIIKKVKHITY